MSRTKREGAPTVGPGSPGLPLLMLVTVRGPSMAPALRHGDRLVARRIRPGTRVRGGAVVLVTWRDYPELLAVKRMVRALSGGHWVEGDNPYGSDDSRSYGPGTVLAVVIARCWPRPVWLRASLRR
ncbi:hypothetical protein BH24ACT9_BH24ACT9_10580 [soil metagenome]